MKALWDPADSSHSTRVRLVNLRLAIDQHEAQELERFPLVVRPRRPTSGHQV
jgi:hypothetical protein